MPPAYTTQTNSTKSTMDFGFYKRARGIKHTAAATPFYPRKPAQVAGAPTAAPAAQQPAGVRAKQPATTTVWLVPPPPPSTVVAMEVVGNGPAPGGGIASDTDVDRRAALYISRVQERLRRERMTDDWRKHC
ncbi:hypothetical protein PAHAL_7G123300 [Panicum hallii]|uniref:Uncharacterized protein n=1 Tax=Panicum hallii TaxID=206008 RepID=A0A2T8IC00_9POAL|nr:hypothetical protein PAHAL_7G123300 [Panicum hallii]